VLVGLMDGQRIEAWIATKGPAYVCPNCKADLILRKGQIVSHHFAHKPPATCAWSSGETQAHLKAKQVLYDAFASRGLRVEVESEVLSIAGDRRADVLVWGREGQQRVAFEVQHQPLGYGAIERRTLAYMAAGVRVVWVALVSASALAEAKTSPAGRVISKYSVRPWEKWAHAYGMGELWFIEPEGGTIWRGELKAHLIEVASSTWYESGGEERSAGGYSRYSKRWRTLHLSGPHPFKKIGLEFFRRPAWSSKEFSVPAGNAAKLTPPK